MKATLQSFIQGIGRSVCFFPILTTPTQRIAPHYWESVGDYISISVENEAPHIREKAEQMELKFEQKQETATSHKTA